MFKGCLLKLLKFTNRLHRLIFYLCFPVYICYSQVNMNSWKDISDHRKVLYKALLCSTLISVSPHTLAAGTWGWMACRPAASSWIGVPHRGRLVHPHLHCQRTNSTPQHPVFMYVQPHRTKLLNFFNLIFPDALNFFTHSSKTRGMLSSLHFISSVLTLQTQWPSSEGWLEHLNWVRTYTKS